MKGMGEARGKFLANMHIVITKEMLPKKFNDRRYSTDYVSPAALEVLKLNGSLKDLRYEHIVPKTKYVKNICEDLAIKGTLTEDFVYDLLTKYFWTATINNQEDKLLKRTSMPKNWDTINIFARYEEKNITLIPHDKSYFMLTI